MRIKPLVSDKTVKPARRHTNPVSCNEHGLSATQASVSNNVVQRLADSEDLIQAPQNQAAPLVGPEINRQSNLHQPLTTRLQHLSEVEAMDRMHPVVRHTDTHAAGLADSLTARAHTSSDNFFFASDESVATGQALIRHDTQQHSANAATESDNIRYGTRDQIADRRKNLVSTTVAPSATHVQRSWWEDLTGGAANALSVGSGVTETIMQAAGSTGASRAADAIAPLAGSGMQSANRILGPASSVLGTGMGLYNMATANTRSGQVQAGADTAASIAGFFGPVGTAFSGGYAGGQLLDQGVGALTGSSLSDRGGDSLYDALGPGPGLWLADKLGI